MGRGRMCGGCYLGGIYIKSFYAMWKTSKLHQLIEIIAIEVSMMNCVRLSILRGNYEINQASFRMIQEQCLKIIICKEYKRNRIRFCLFSSHNIQFEPNLVSPLFFHIFQKIISSIFNFNYFFDKATYSILTFFFYVFFMFYIPFYRDKYFTSCFLIFSIYQKSDPKMKKAQSKQSLLTKPQKKQHKAQNKIHIKLRNRKNNENTASTLGSRSSMDSKFTKRKINNEDKIQSCRAGLLKQRGSVDYGELGNTNKRSRFAINLEENNGDEVGNQGLVSFREYCMVGNRWIPLLTSTQRQRIVNPGLEKSNKVIEVAKQQQQQRKSSHKQFNQQPTITQTLQKLQQQIEHNNHQFEQIPPETKEYYYKILKNVISKLYNRQEEQKDQHQNVLRNISNESGKQLIHGENKKRNILSGQKSHWFEKNKGAGKQNGQNDNDTSIGQHTLNDNSLSDRQNKPQEGQEQCQNNTDDSSPVKNLKFDQDPQVQGPSIQDMIKLRQLKQMGFLRNINEQENELDIQNNSTTIDTSIACISRYIKNIQHVIIKQNFTSQILNNLKLAWGYQKIEKLQKIRNNKYLGSTGDVLPEYLFEYVEDFTCKNNLYEFIHNKCIFDCVNWELNKLKPFFQSNGETFPWNFKLSSPLTFFEIDEKSLALAFEEIKIKLLELSSLLCGLLLQIPPDHHEFHLLVKRRHEKQDMMLKKYNDLEQYMNMQDNCIENKAVLILQDVSKNIFMELITQFAGTL